MQISEEASTELTLANSLINSVNKFQNNIFYENFNEDENNIK